jgi:hypothetical protein
MSECENIDGQCGSSWCDCDYQRRKRGANDSRPATCYSRLAFENWFEADSMPFEQSNWFARYDDGGYEMDSVDRSWDAWQAASMITPINTAAKEVDVQRLVRLVIDETVSRAKQACRYAMKHQEFSDSSNDYRMGWEVGTEVCKDAIAENVGRHVEDIIAKALYSLPNGEDHLRA